MTNASVATDFNQTLDIHCDISSQVALNDAVLVDIVTQLCNVFFRQILYPNIRIDTGTSEDFVCCAATDSIDKGVRKIALIRSLQ